MKSIELTTNTHSIQVRP